MEKRKEQDGGGPVSAACGSQGLWGSMEEALHCHRPLMLMNPRVEAAAPCGRGPPQLSHYKTLGVSLEWGALPGIYGIGVGSSQLGLQVW